MPLVCPNCKNEIDFRTIGKPNFMQCSKCETIFPVDGNFREDEK